VKKSGGRLFNSPGKMEKRDGPAFACPREGELKDSRDLYHNPKKRTGAAASSRVREEPKRSAHERGE